MYLYLTAYTCSSCCCPVNGFRPPFPCCQELSNTHTHSHCLSWRKMISVMHSPHLPHPHTLTPSPAHSHLLVTLLQFLSHIFALDTLHLGGPAFCRRHSLSCTVLITVWPALAPAGLQKKKNRITIVTAAAIVSQPLIFHSHPVHATATFILAFSTIYS